jgi:sarcosine oxidase, subunit gamma
MSELQVTSALQHRDEPEGLSIDLREIEGRGMIDLRGLASDDKFLAAVKDVTGFDLPTVPRTSAAWGEFQALWLAPDQWLILCTGARRIELRSNLCAALEGIHSLAVDVSDMRAVLRVEGAAARNVLLKGCSLDLLGAGYGVGTARRVRFAEIAALLHVVSEKPDAIDLYVFRSYADYAWDWFLANARAEASVALFGAQDAPLT